MNIILLYFAIKYKGDWDAIFKALETKERVSIEDINKTEKMIKDNKWEYATIVDRDYPMRFKEAYKPPFVIWFKGNRELIEKKKLITISGEIVDETLKKRLNTQLAEYEKCYNLLLLDYKGVNDVIKKIIKTPYVEILAGGIDYGGGESDNLSITEYPPNTSPKKEYFKNRNRLIAALSQSLVLLNSHKDGKINNLVSNYLNLGKEIYCYPGIGDYNDGNSELIKQGALLITGPNDIL